MDDRHNLDGTLCRYGSGDGSVAMKCEDNARSSRSAPDAPRSLLDLSFDIFDVLRWATHTAYPEARIPETAMPNDFIDKLRARADTARSEAWDRWYATLPEDLKRRLSFHDFQRLGECFRVAFGIEKVRPPEDWLK